MWLRHSLLHLCLTMCPSHCSSRWESFSIRGSAAYPESSGRTRCGQVMIDELHSCKTAEIILISRPPAPHPTVIQAYVLLVFHPDPMLQYFLGQCPRKSMQIKSPNSTLTFLDFTYFGKLSFKVDLLVILWNPYMSQYTEKYHKNTYIIKKKSAES